MEQAIVLDTNDKVTAVKEKITKESIANNTIRSMRNQIGELSNLATRVWNRVPRTEEEKIRQKDYVDLLSTIVGKSIDSVKTNVLWFPPKKIAKTYRAVPYFMKYISPYYAKTKRFSHSPSNMNLLAKHIEKWERNLKYKTNKASKANKDNPNYKSFDYTIMIDSSLIWDVETYLKIEQLYKQFLVDFKELKYQQRMSYKSPDYYNYFSGISKDVLRDTNVDWNSTFEKYKKKARKICPNQKELANYAVTMCYEKESNEKNFAWIVAEEGVVENIVPQEILLPVYDKSGEYEYLGKKYSLVPYEYCDSTKENIDNESTNSYRRDLNGLETMEDYDVEESDLAEGVDFCDTNL